MSFSGNSHWCHSARHFESLIALGRLHENLEANRSRGKSACGKALVLITYTPKDKIGMAEGSWRLAYTWRD